MIDAAYSFTAFVLAYIYLFWYLGLCLTLQRFSIVNFITSSWLTLLLGSSIVLCDYLGAERSLALRTTIHPNSYVI